MAPKLSFGILMSLALALPCAIEARTETGSAPIAVANVRSPASPLLKFGTFKRPFAANSPWNVMPINPVLDDYTLPKTAYFPFFGTGPYTTGVFEAKSGDAAAVVRGLTNPDGLWNTDESVFKEVTIPRWPANVLPASGTDGHADIVDPQTGIVHSFWQLRRVDDGWRATQYAWTALNGRGWSDPAHNHQGARAAGVPTMAGLIRQHELDDGDSLFRHVVAITLDGSALRKGYVFPATAEDDNAAQNYRGGVPMGSLLMLPANFDTTRLQTPSLRKLAETLKRYGGAVVDQNHDTRFTVPVEQGARFDLHAGGWNSAAGDDLNTIADALRRVVSVDGWLDGNGKKTSLSRNLNLLSMRGPWTDSPGGARARFDSWKQLLRFEPRADAVSSEQIVGKSQRMTAWAPWQPGQTYSFSVQAQGGAQLRLQFRQPDSQVIWETPNLGNGQRIDFAMPSATGLPLLVATSGIGQPSWVRGRLIAKNVSTQDVSTQAQACPVESESCRTAASNRKPKR